MGFRIQQQEQQQQNQQQSQEQQRQQQEQYHQQQQRQQYSGQEAQGQRERDRQRQIIEQRRHLQEQRAYLAKLEKEKKEVYYKELKSHIPKISAEIERLKKKRELSFKSMIMLKDIKADLKNETWWHTSELAEQIGRAGVFINMHCDLILDLLEVPPNGKLKKIAIDVSKSLIENAINQEKFSFDMVISLLSEISILEKYTYGKLLIDLSLTFKSYGEKIKELTNIESDRKKVMDEVNEQLIRIETEFYKYQMEIKKSDELIKGYEFIIRKIDNYKKKIT